MKLIIGLGNPGKKYQNTRHNLGFETLDYLAAKLETINWQKKEQLNVLITEKIFDSQKIILAKPQGFMNNSGSAVKTIINYFKIPISDLIVIHDDLDLPLGEFKIQRARGSAGHRGVQSIIDALDTNDFTRIRIGISPLQTEYEIEAEKFVLQKFTADEEKIILETIKKISKTFLEKIKKGLH